MSFQITTAFVSQFRANVDLLSQQKGSRLENAVRRETQRGKHQFFEQIGATVARKRTTRHSDTPLIHTPHARRRVTLVSFDWADLIDDEDRVRLLIDPTSSYAQNAAYAMGRAKDDVIIEAFTADAFTGEDGSTIVPFPTEQTIEIGGQMTIEALIQAKEKLDESEVDPDMPRFFACTSKVLSTLLNTTEIKSADYNTVKALVKGEIDTFLGFKFIRTERLPVNRAGMTGTSCFAWAQDGIVLAIGKDSTAKITERSDKNYATQVFYSMSIGATRMEEVKVVELVAQTTRKKR